MSSSAEIRPDIFWVGARHPELEVFDELFPTRHGTTYNAYLVRGSEKIALIDTVKEPFTDEYLDKLKKLVPLADIDLVVVNHTEPDHSGALGRLLEINPNIQVYCTRAGENFLRQLYERPFSAHAVSDGEEISLGDKTLRFLLAPNLHWPDTMFTYVPEEDLLFSCDGFGAHYCGDGLYNDQVEDFSTEFRFYFDTIMRPFKAFIREAVAKVENLPLTLLCPSHGPILRRDPQAAIQAYREWSAAPAAGANKQVLLLTLSPHGNTRTMAAAVREGLESAGAEVTEFGLVDLDDELVRDELERADALVVGSPTINRDAPPPVWRVLALLSSVTPKGKVGAVFGSYGWSGEAVKLIEERLRGLKYQLPVPGISFRFTPTDKDVETCREFGRNLARSLTQDG
ncbi:FprA family A-type flavoprotein [Geoalkalibacter halelectricus]|uniref:FprA family A-type flavoprotein n=1 Tax=Geoalkalibacter halelectricus TaxID=2847045 RepID=A0ABY5ZQH4_9BACT|nr:FprA family A-type flavoprotein [Geoalkalibacter halelectricus]MDO3377377.1 FprA family A-type flavoprotein [Geoalkalibacter halelectricus]UWZ80858.1 FprA family A-type flavoprotein [Geoalkalibacter halelectricus]